MTQQFYFWVYIQNTNLKKYIHACVHSQDMKATKCPSIDKWVKKTVVHMHVHNGVVLAHKKNNEILPFATAWMDLEGIMPSEISQSEKEKYHDFTYRWNLKNKINKQNRNKLKIQKQTDGCQRGGRLGD